MTFQIPDTLVLCGIAVGDSSHRITGLSLDLG
jgi:hypothetical protein